LKLEYLEDGDNLCPLIRLYDFRHLDAIKFRNVVNKLASGMSDNIKLHDMPFINSVNHCQLTLKRRIDNDQGIYKNIGISDFSCSLTKDSWSWLEELVNPFCKSDSSNGHQWLTESSDITLLLSNTGKW